MDPYDKMLAAGPDEAPLFTVTYRTAVIVENTQSTVSEAMGWLRERLGKDATITGDHDETGLYFHIEDEVEEVTDEDHARETVEGMIAGGEHQMVLDGFDIDAPEDDEPDWMSIAKDRRIDAEIDDRLEG